MGCTLWICHNYRFRSKPHLIKVNVFEQLWLCVSSEGHEMGKTTKNQLHYIECIVRDYAKLKNIHFRHHQLFGEKSTSIFK